MTEQKLGTRSVDKVDVTPALAKKWLAGNVANRDERPRHVQSLARAMTQGEWLPTPEPIVFADHWTNPVSGEEFGETLTAGQHRLKAVILSGKTIEFIVFRHSDAAELRVMSQGKPWSQGDILKATRVGLKHPGKVASILSGFLRHGLGYTEGMESWMARRLLDRIEPEVMQAVTYKGRLGSIVHRQFMAALLFMILIEPESVEEFVKMLKTGSGIPFGDVTKTLRLYLYDHIMSPRKDMSEVYFQKCCNGIAAKLKGEPLKKLEAEPAGLKYLRGKAAAKIEPMLKDLFGATPQGFFSPRAPRIPEPRIR